MSFMFSEGIINLILFNYILPHKKKKLQKL